MANTAPAAPPPELRRILGTGDGLAIVVGVVIGVGIFSAPGLIARQLGDPALILGLWVAVACVVGLSTLVFAELAAMLPQAGGKYVYTRVAFGDVVGFAAGWAELVGTRVFFAASKAVVVAGFLAELAGRGSVPVIAGAIVLLFLLLHLREVRAGVRLQNALTLLKVALLLAILGAAFSIGAGPSAGDVSAPPRPPLFAGLALAYQAVWFTYYSWDQGVVMAGEVRDPGRNMPRILFRGAATVALLYILLNIAFLRVLSPAQMAGSAFVARDVIALRLGPAAAPAFTVASIAIILSSLNANFLANPRIAFGLARDRLAPAVFSRVSGGGTPIVAVLFYAVIVLVLAVTGTFESLIRLGTFVALVVDGVVLVALFALRRRRPDAVRPFRVPFYPVLPALVVVLYCAVLAIIIVTQPMLALGGTGLLALCVIAGVFVTRRQRMRFAAAAARAGGIAR